MSAFDTVATVADLRSLDDSAAKHMRAALVEGYSWFLLDRSSSRSDDGKATTTCLSGVGRWEIMTPETAGIVASIKDL